MGHDTCLGMAMAMASIRAAARVPVLGRSLATKAKKAAADGPVEIPVRLHGLDGRYATSLYTVAVRKGAVDAVESDLGSLRGSLGSSKALSELVSNPSIPKKAKVEAIDALNAKSGFADPTKNLLALLAENNRLSELENVADKYDEMLRAARGQIFAEVTVAEELSKSQRQSLQKSLGSFLTKGQTLTMSVKTDASILGGLVVEIGDKHVDLSILSRITKLQNELNAAI